VVHVGGYGPTAALVTELLQLLALDYGTVYCHISEMEMCALQCVLLTFLF